MLLSTMTNIHQTYRHTKKEYAYPAEEAIEYIARAGFPGVDLSLISVCAYGNILGTDRWPEFVESCAETIERTHITVCQAHAFYSQEPDAVLGNDAFLRDKEFTARTIRVAATLGAPWITLHPVYGSRLPGMDADQMSAFNLEFFKEMGETAAQAGIGIAIENMIAPPFNDPERIMDLLDRLHDDTRFGFCLDTGHANMNRIDMPALILRLGGRLKTTHIHDNHGQRDEHLLPYLGDIEWDGIMHALHRSGYQGAFNFEVPQTTRNIPAVLHDDIIRYACTLGNYLLKLE
ncbi:MAG: sugar phosphate isomerase/epimerase [Clostridia bacterium]|nr:sugar phosphate isomerase/epimerase [Clostridia bacterium]